MKCVLRLTNGWTVSIAEDGPYAIASVAAWPTRKDNQKLADEDWFKFDDRGQLDRRCWNLEDIQAALNMISIAPEPPC